MNIFELAHAMDQARSLPIRDRRKLARGWGHAAMALEKAGALVSSTEMDIALRALAAGATVHSWPQAYHMSRARLLQKRRDLLGLPEPVIAQEKALTLDVEAGGAYVRDAAVNIGEWPAQTAMHRWMMDVGFYFVSFGGDGALKIRVRVHVSGPVEPQSSEFRRLREATPEGCVRVPSGNLFVHGGGVKAIRMCVDPGNYLVAAYGLGIGRKPDVLILLSPMGGVPPAPLDDTPSLPL